MKKPKLVKFGYALWLKRGAKKERVGYLFFSSHEAREWKEIHYPDVKMWSVNAVRLNTEGTHEHV